MSLAETVAGNVAVAAAIALVASWVGRGYRNNRIAHLLWMAVLIKLITPPLVRLPVPVAADWLPGGGAAVAPAALERNLPADAEGHLAAGDIHIDGGGDGGTEKTAGAFEVVSAAAAAGPWKAFGVVLLSIWAVGAMAAGVGGVFRYRRLSRLLRQEGRCHPAASGFVAGLLRETKHKVAPEVVFVPVVISPMLFGWGHSAKIVCPQPLWQQLTDGDREALLAHEAAHYSRGDHRVRWLEWLVTSLYWWLPLAYWARHHMRRHEEACCDAWAVERLGRSPRGYAAALLAVVDYLSERPQRLPGMASGMRPTDAIEQRLRRLLQPMPAGRQPYPERLAAGLSIAMIAIHPVAAVLPPAPAAATSARIVASSLPPGIQAADGLGEEPWGGLDQSLPPMPIGFWSASPPPQWADLALPRTKKRLVASVDRGIAVVDAAAGDLHPLQFSPEELTALATVAQTGRAVIGDARGDIRLWDLAAAAPVSLIGSHAPAAVTSLAYHSNAGLVSADSRGNVIRWELQSGQMLATTAAGRAVQSIRFSEDGRQVVLLIGSWRDDTPQQLCWADAASLEKQRQVEAHLPLATVRHDRGRWIGVAWDGGCFDVQTRWPAGSIGKTDVSAAALYEDAWQQLELHELQMALPVSIPLTLEW